MTPPLFHLLVVDDEPSVLITYRLILEQQGYRVTAAPSSAEARAALGNGDIDMLLCDLSLEQRHSGLEVIAEARRKDPAMPTLLLTGYATRDSVEKAEESGVSVMFKPIDLQEFLSTISSMLRSRYDQAKAGGR